MKITAVQPPPIERPVTLTVELAPEEAASLKAYLGALTRQRIAETFLSNNHHADYVTHVYDFADATYHAMRSQE